MKRYSILNFVLFTLIVGFCFNSCTVEKRRFRSGYYVNWKSNQKLVNKDVTFHQDDVVIEETEDITSPNVIENSKAEQDNSEIFISSVKKIEI